MKKLLLASAVLALLGISATLSVLAQPPGGELPPRGDHPDGPPPGGRRGEGGPGEPGRPALPNPLVAALDTNGDHEISAEELAAAATSLLTLDKNKDGKLTDDEMRPPRPERGRGFGRGDGPPRGEGFGRGDGPPGRPDARRGDGPPGRHGRGPGDGRPGGGPMGPPNPERFVGHAMSFDADGDGKLDKSELTKFAEELSGRFGGPHGDSGPDDGPPGGRATGPGRDQDEERPPQP